MLLNRVPVYIILILCLITVCTLFSIKSNVIIIRAELSEVNKQLQSERDTIHVLKAELAYLSSPERLQKLNNVYLKLKDTKVSQMISDPLKQAEPVYIASNAPKARVRWNYKRGASKYLIRVSSKK
ncbi:MAG: hypothetical protein COA94_05380 [Rickettsiales bacterium]|nr:MAG: hypothetical protein COA94_05380 [Rickettsiales bacterium]